jgi:hypothetical protein
MSPKDKFLKAFPKFSDVVDSVPFQVACDATLLTFLDSLPRTTDAQAAMSNGYKVEAAKQVIEIFKHIATPINPPRPAPSGNLQHHP